MNRNRIHLQHVIRNQILCWGRISIRGKRGHVDDSNLYLNCVCVCVCMLMLLSVCFSGIRTEQDLYVRLIDSMTKQVR